MDAKDLERLTERIARLESFNRPLSRAIIVRFLVLAATHISMSLVWLSIYAVSIGTLSERLARPKVRR